MEVRIVHDASTVYEFLKTKTRYNYIYQFNNLSPNVWKYVVCYGLFEGDQLKEIAMMMMNCDIPVLLSASFDNQDYSNVLISKLKPFLPAKFYTHMDKSTLEKVFSQNNIVDLEDYINMGLCDHHVLNNKQASEEVRLGSEDLAAIEELISVSHPEAWLDAELVSLNENFGIYLGEKLISFAGIHAYSEQYDVAAVAHVTTHPEFRRRGYAEKTVAALSKSLSRRIKFIGLNVKINNSQAVNCYRKLGYQEFGKFVACEITDNYK